MNSTRHEVGSVVHGRDGRSNSNGLGWVGSDSGLEPLLRSLYSSLCGVFSIPFPDVQMAYGSRRVGHTCHADDFGYGLVLVLPENSATTIHDCSGQLLL